MSQSGKVQLIASEEAANQLFTTDNILEGGCIKCGCEVWFRYHYDSGRPVPEAPFTLIDAKGHTHKGKTDQEGLCRIVDIPYGAYDLQLEEGSDAFLAPELDANNPIREGTAADKALAAEYFSLYALLHQENLLYYDVDDSSSKYIDIERRILQRVPEQYRAACGRYYALLDRINKGSEPLRAAVNRYHSSLAGEVADHTVSNPALLLFAEVVLGCVPVVGQAMDCYYLGQWCLDTVEGDELDEWHWANGALVGVGFIPGLGDAVKKTGQALLNALRRNQPQEIRRAMKMIRGLSDGNLVNYLNSLAGTLSTLVSQLKQLLTTLAQALDELLSNSKNWLKALAGEALDAMTAAIRQLGERLDGIVG